MLFLGQRHDPGNNTTINQPPDSPGGSRGILATPADFIAPPQSAPAPPQHSCAPAEGLPASRFRVSTDWGMLTMCSGRGGRAAPPTAPSTPRGEPAPRAGEPYRDPNTAAAQALTPALAHAFGHHSTDTSSRPVTRMHNGELLLKMLSYQKDNFSPAGQRLGSARSIYNLPLMTSWGTMTQDGFGGS